MQDLSDPSLLFLKGNAILQRMKIRSTLLEPIEGNG